MEMKEYAETMMKFHQKVIDFLESQNESDDCFTELVDYFENHKTNENKTELKELFIMISKIAKYHHFDHLFKKRIQTILLFYKKDILKLFQNNEIFDIFKNNKQILLFLFTNEIITVDKFIVHSIINKYEENYPQFFYPEIKPYISKEEIKEIESEISSCKDSFEQNRQIGENDSYICILIRQDLVKEFITYVNQSNTNLSGKIKKSIFETNYFLNKKEPTLIEYATYFGSIQIIRYLFYENINLTESLLVYAAHSKSPELIHFLEENIDLSKEKFYKCCFLEAIKCHHGDIAEYMQNNIKDFEIYIYNDERVFEYSTRYHNFEYFTDCFIDNFPFYTLAKYRYYSFFNHYLEIKKDEIESKIITKKLIF